MKETINGKYIGRKEVAEILGVSRQTVTNYVEKGFFKTKKVGNMVYIEKESMFDNIPTLKEVAILENAVEESKRELRHLLMDYRKQICGVSRAISADKGVLFVNALDRLMESVCNMGIKASKSDCEMAKAFFSRSENSSLSSIQEISNSRILVRLTRMLRKAEEAMENSKAVELEDQVLKQRICRQNAHIKALQTEAKKKDAYIKQLEKTQNIDRIKSEKVYKPNMRNINLLNTKIMDFDLSVRALNALRGYVVTIEDLVRINSRDVAKFRNLGLKTRNEVMDKLEPYGLRLGMTEKEIEAFKFSE